MIQSQFNLDHRLAELRQAGVDHRLAQSRTGAKDSGATQSRMDSIRSLLGGSTAGSRTVGLAAR